MDGHIQKKTVTSMHEVDFYDELLSVVLIEDVMYVALQPIVHNLLLDWEMQYHYLITDIFLSKYILSITMCGEDGQQQDLLCLHLEHLPGWLLRLQTLHQKEKLLRYQNECFHVLWACFQKEWIAQLLLEYKPSLAAPLLMDADDLSTTLLQVRNMALAIAQLANEHLELPTAGSFPASVVAHPQPTLEYMVMLPQNPGNPVSDVQIDEMCSMIETICDLLGKKGTTPRNAYRYVFEELYHGYGLTSYKLLSQDLFTEVIAFLTNWHQTLWEQVQHEY